MSIDIIARYYLDLARTKRYFLTGNFEENLKQAEHDYIARCLSLGISLTDIPSLISYVRR